MSCCTARTPFWPHRAACTACLPARPPEPAALLAADLCLFQWRLELLPAMDAMASIHSIKGDFVINITVAAKPGKDLLFQPLHRTPLSIRTGLSLHQPMPKVFLIQDLMSASDSNASRFLRQSVLRSSIFVLGAQFFWIRCQLLLVLGSPFFSPCGDLLLVLFAVLFVLCCHPLLVLGSPFSYVCGSFLLVLGSPFCTVCCCLLLVLFSPFFVVRCCLLLVLGSPFCTVCCCLLLVPSLHSL